MTSLGTSSGGAGRPTDWPRPARLTVGLVSAGRVGTALGAGLERAGHVVGACSANSDSSLLRARTRLPETRILPTADVVAQSELVILAVPDGALTDVVRRIAQDNPSMTGKIVVHTSGANGVAILEPLTRLGAIGLAIHPAMTFTGRAEDTDRLASACFGVTASDEIGFAIAQTLVLELGGEPVRVPEASRALYHAALAHGCNHLVTLVGDAVTALEAALGDEGLLGQEPGAGPTGAAQRMLAPLLGAALDNALRYGDDALTGPVARDDGETVARHLRALAEVDPRMAAGYRAMSLRTAQRAGDRTELIELLEERP